MNSNLEPLRVRSLKDACIDRLEGLILSGEWQAGEKLPSERDLAARLDISRPLLHEALVDLAAKGLVTIIPRRAVVVNDFRKSGSCAIISTLLSYNQGALSPQFEDSLFDMRCLLEAETARLSAENATDEHIQQLEEILAREAELERGNLSELVELDFEFHLQVSLASGNMVYPLIINSFKNVYTHFTSEFFKRWQDTPVIDEVYAYHRKLVDAIRARQPQSAGQIMLEALEHGENYLKEESDGIND